MVQPEGSGPKDGRVVLSVNLEVGSLDSDSSELFSRAGYGRRHPFWLQRRRNQGSLGLG